MNDNGRRIAVERKTVQKELLSALRRQRKLEEKIERLRGKLRKLGDDERAIP